MKIAIATAASSVSQLPSIRPTGVGEPVGNAPGRLLVGASVFMRLLLRLGFVRTRRRVRAREG